MKTIVSVIMLVDTTFGGQRLHVGEEVGVVDDVAQRWVARKIAKLNAEATSQDNIEELSAKQLYAMCIERGIETKPKLEREVYLSLLAKEG